MVVTLFLYAITNALGSALNQKFGSWTVTDGAPDWSATRAVFEAN